MQKEEIKKLIDQEHGDFFNRNIKLSGYTIYRKESFITFHFVEINNIQTVMIDYLYVTSKNDFIRLLAFCISFWQGYKVQYIYYKEHKRQANYAEKYFKLMGFTVLDEYRDNAWKYDWVSSNGYPENQVIEAFV